MSKVIVYQTDDRLKKEVYGEALNSAVETIQHATLYASLKYPEARHEFWDDPLTWGNTLKPNTKVPQYFADAALMIKYLKYLNDGDIVIYVDTDVVSLRNDSIQQLVDYIKNSDKSFFISSTITTFNAGIFAIKVNHEIKEIYPAINWSDSEEYVETKFGPKYTPNEVPIIDAVHDNFMNINNQIAFLPNDKFNVRPNYKVTEDDFDDGLPRPTDETCLVHFMTENGKNELIKYFKED